MLNKLVVFNIILMSVCLILSCSNTNKHVVNRYYLVESEVSRSLAFKLDNGQYIDVVKPSVFSIAHDSTFIIVKQHPQPFSQLPKNGITNYFIIPLRYRISVSPDLNVYGPLSEHEYFIKKTT